MTTKEAAEAIGISQSYVKQLVAAGRIKAELLTVSGDLKVYDIEPSEVQRFKRLKIKSRGVPRGSKR